MTPTEKREVKRLKELLVRHGNRANLLDFDMVKKNQRNRVIVERERKRYWDLLMAADPRLLKIAADELNAMEEKWWAS